MLRIRDGEFHLYHCWACSIELEYEGRLWQRGGGGPTRWELYERVVEWVESRRPGYELTRNDCWRSLGGGPTIYGLVRLAFRDMVLHGILECTRRRSNGACLAFKVVDSAWTTMPPPAT